jgi:hypothetical protein
MLLYMIYSHRVYSVNIYGAFELVTSGAVTLVGIPSFGDVNKQGIIV